MRERKGEDVDVLTMLSCYTLFVAKRMLMRIHLRNAAGTDVKQHVETVPFLFSYPWQHAEMTLGCATLACGARS